MQGKECAQIRRIMNKISFTSHGHELVRQFSFQDENKKAQDFSNDPDEMAKILIALDKDYMQKWQEGRRMRKKPQQMEILNQFFNQNPDWTYALKMRIAQEIGMTPNQVSKWNWDQRKKLGMPTERKQRGKKAT